MPAMIPLSMLNRLHGYGSPINRVSALNHKGAQLRLLRKLEEEGLATIQLIANERYWVTTPAGALVVLLEKHGTLAFYTDVLCGEGFWMTSGEATIGVMHLVDLDYVTATNIGVVEDFEIRPCPKFSLLRRAFK
ncbi:hypothetical protein KIKIMORA_01050 [Brevundimonas phage vB_BpoS-Kikimora]|uniref:Uncharacterized protein n=1 Tax=Brevundimonas phage vB_BpoS-Kikimora TaxID=2948601 RepID=A0A9E7SKY8_9CAUD|nr:hypothetical protein KIKIMORA_01050 [Brevundimonas phage vB_BpoS-Kikimora]